MSVDHMSVDEVLWTKCP